LLTLKENQLKLQQMELLQAMLLAKQLSVESVLEQSLQLLQ
jgi:hypothetical protein